MQLRMGLRPRKYFTSMPAKTIIITITIIIIIIIIIYIYIYIYIYISLFKPQTVTQRQ